MNKNDLLNQYIAENVLRQTSQWNEDGSEIFNNIVQIFEFANHIKFVPCNTYSKECYLMEYFGDVFLVFDVYMLETLLEMNSIALNNRASKDMEKLAYRLLSEEYFVMQRYAVSLFMALKFKGRSGYHYLLQLSESNQKTALTYTNVQQWFVIAHEVMHQYYAEYKRENPDYQAKRIYLKNVLVRHGFVDADTNDTINDWIEYIDKNDSIVEECFCDSTAFIAVMSVLSKRISIPDLATALFLGIQHLRAISYIKTEAHILSSQKFVGEDIFLHATIRIIHARYALLDHISDEYPDHKSDASNKLQQSFIQYNEKQIDSIVRLTNNLGVECVNIHAENIQTESAIQRFILDLIK